MSINDKPAGVLITVWHALRQLIFDSKPLLPNLFLYMAQGRAQQLLRLIIAFIGTARAAMMTAESSPQSCPCQFRVSLTTSRLLHVGIQVISLQSYNSWAMKRKPDKIVKNVYVVPPGEWSMEKYVRSRGRWILLVYSTRVAAIEISAQSSLSKCFLRLHFSMLKNKTHKALAESNELSLSSSEHILNGSPLSISSGDYTVMLRQGRLTCSGSVVAPRWILTAAHCVTSPERIEVFVVGTQHRSVTHVHLHPEFKQSRYGTVADIALVQLSAPLHTTPIAIHAKLSQPLEGRYARQTGFGRHKISRTSDMHLRAADIPIVNISKCRLFFKEKGYRAIPRALDEHSQLCTDARECGMGSCVGDSGGPLVIEGKNVPIVQVGVLSFSVGGCGALPDVFVRVASYSDWFAHISGGEIDLQDALVDEVAALRQR